MEKHTLTRDGKPPLTFTGELLAKADNRNHDSTRWTTVTIYATKGGKIVSHVSRLSQWQGESGHDDAGSFADLGCAIDWLKGDDETLGRVSQEAVEKTIKARPEMASFWIEEIE